MFLGDDGQRYPLLIENLRDLQQWGDRVVALAGLAHLAIDRSTLYRVAPGTDGRWHAERWLPLPAAPRRSGLTEDGQLFVDTGGGGPVLVDASGVMRMAPCLDAQSKGL